MAEPERVRIEIAFDGGQIMGALVSPAGADALEQALGSAELRAGTGEAALALDAESPGDRSTVDTSVVLTSNRDSAAGSRAMAASRPSSKAWS